MLLLTIMVYRDVDFSSQHLGREKSNPHELLLSSMAECAILSTRARALGSYFETQRSYTVRKTKNPRPLNALLQMPRSLFMWSPIEIRKEKVLLVFLFFSVCFYLLFPFFVVEI